MSELSPHVSLAEKLGRLAVQLVAGESGIKGVKVVYTTTRAPDDLDTRLLRAMVTKGIVEPVSSTFVNLVNADYTAKQRGLRITEERVSHESATAETPLESIQVRLSQVQSKFAGAISDGGDIVLEGRVKYGVPHLTLVGPYEVDVSLEGNLILCRQIDQPGMIGKVGNILGQRNVNINFMSVGRTFRGKRAIMAIGVDEEPNKEALEQTGAVPAIEEFVFLEL
jgi:D-3-phosphoglycerate dehydrogenase / 2-oxoglutarate reductase